MSLPPYTTPQNMRASPYGRDVSYDGDGDTISSRYRDASSHSHRRTSSSSSPLSNESSNDVDHEQALKSLQRRVKTMQSMLFGDKSNRFDDRDVIMREPILTSAPVRDTQPRTEPSPSRQSRGSGDVVQMLLERINQCQEDIAEGTSSLRLLRSENEDLYADLDKKKANLKEDQVKYQNTVRSNAMQSGEILAGEKRLLSMMAQTKEAGVSEIQRLDDAINAELDAKNNLEHSVMEMQDQLSFVRTQTDREIENKKNILERQLRLAVAIKEAKEMMTVALPDVRHLASAEMPRCNDNELIKMMDDLRAELDEKTLFFEQRIEQDDRTVSLLNDMKSRLHDDLKRLGDFAAVLGSERVNRQSNARRFDDDDVGLESTTRPAVNNSVSNSLRTRAKSFGETSEPLTRSAMSYRRHDGGGGGGIQTRDTLKIDSNSFRLPLSNVVTRTTPTAGHDDRIRRDIEDFRGKLKKMQM